MKNFSLLIVNVILGVILVVVNSSSNTTIFYSSPSIRVRDTKTDTITNLDLDEYIIGVVAAEMPASFNEEALKAQAVAARTYAVYKMQNSSKSYDVVTDVSNQGYITVSEMKKKWNSDFQKYYDKIKNAVKETSNQIMYYDDSVIEAFYFAMSNGYTEDVELVFSEKKDYLKSVKSSYEKSNKNFSVEKAFTIKEFCSLLHISCSSINIGKVERSNTNRVNKITINNKIFKGTEVRKLLKLRSTDFYIDINEGQVNITTKGYGHGVGMSQYGANGMANEGYTYDEILKYYYQNIKISSI